MRVFISHSSKDKPAVERLALALEAAGLQPWFDAWEIAAGDSIVDRINQGLEEAEAGILVFSAGSRESRWVEAEAGYLTYARIQEGKLLIPVMAGDDAWVPPLLRPLARRGIDEVEAIVGALQSRKPRRAGSAAGPSPTQDGRIERVVVSLRRDGGDAVRVAVTIGGVVHAAPAPAVLPRELLALRDAFLRGFRAGAHRSPEQGARMAFEKALAELGRALGRFCLPLGAAEALASLADGCGVGTTVEVLFEADEPELLGLPFEALRLPDDRPLALHPAVVVLRRPSALASKPFVPPAGPLKILVAVGAPDEGQTAAVVLDQERELQNILDGVDEARRRENVEVRILEVGDPEEIAKAIERDTYHVLHLSCHGMPGALELADEEGRAVRVAPGDLLAPVQAQGRPLPLVFLNSCHGGVEVGTEQTASFAEALLAAGVPAVVAMQTSVSDAYATRLAHAFYEHLAGREPVLASRALAAARRELEAERRKRVQEGAPLGETLPEHATATLFVAGEEPVLADFGADKAPLRARPAHDLSGPVPQLRLDELIGRRKELRETLRTLRDPQRRFAGVLLTGLGGVGKSAVAGRAMRRLVESGYVVAAHVGRFDLAAIAASVGAALLTSRGGKDLERAKLLADRQLDDELRMALLEQALAEEPVVLVLDDFEQNLTQPGGGAFLDPDTAAALGRLAQSARRGRLLLTCRYPVPGTETDLCRIPLGALSLAESRKLLLRLPGLAQRAPAELARVLRVIGGHPRMLEFLDGLLRGGEGRLGLVTAKLQETLAGAGMELEGPVADLDEALQQAILLGARDVLLEELLALARTAGDDEVLLHLAVSNLPVLAAGLAHMLADAPADPAPIAPALRRLEALSLAVLLPDGEAWVHRWTAEGLAKLTGEAAWWERCNRAGRYRWWRVENETHDLGDAVEALRNHLAGRDFDAAAAIALACFGALTRFRQATQLAALANEVLETLPEDHGRYARVADAEAEAHLALGLTERAFARYDQLLATYRRRVQAEPNRAVYQRNLSVSFNKMGDLYSALGQGEKARDSYASSLAIRERLASSEPDRADYQRDLSVSYERMGDLYSALGQGEKARDSYASSLAIRERLASSEPDRADYQRDLSVSFIKMGDLYSALGQGEKARDSYASSLAIRERLASSEPDRADYQQDLAVSYERMGDLYSALDESEKARDSYASSLAIRERLASSEPDRADYQRDLSVSFDKMGDLYRALGEGEKAREYYLQDLAIAERLASSEPDRADYQRDLSVSFNKMGDLYSALGEGEKARDSYASSLAIAERLASSEPDRADYQVDLVISLVRVGGADLDTGRPLLERALAVLRTLDAEGRLAPAHHAKIPALLKMLGLAE